MSTSINTLKRLLLILLVVSGITYLVSLNLENHFIMCNSKWISNEFLFAIVCGVLASLFVVIVCEYIKYRQLKYALEQTLFVYLSNLYGQVLIIRGNCKRALKNNELIADNLIQSSCDNAMMIADTIASLDYSVFNGKNKIAAFLLHFRIENRLLINNMIIGFAYLRIAIREDSKQLLLQGKRDVVTSDCPKVNETLNKIVDRSTVILTFLDQQILQLNDEFNNGHRWQSIRKVLNDYQNNYSGQSLDDYLHKEIESL